MPDIVTDIVDLWSDLNPAAGYTGGHLATLTTLFQQTGDATHAMQERIRGLEARLPEIGDDDLRTTAAAVLTSLGTQLLMSRPSGAGPSGTGMGGVWAAADGVFYIVLKGDHGAPFVPDYLESVRQMVEFETGRWWGQGFDILVRRECLNTAAYLEGTLTALVAVRPDVASQAAAIHSALDGYRQIFFVEGLTSTDFATWWAVLQRWDAASGPARADHYPECLSDYYQLSATPGQIETMARGWLDIDLPVTTSIAEAVAALPFADGGGSLQEVWDKVSAHYSVDFSQWMEKLVAACNDFGKEHVISFTDQDQLRFGPTPDYLVNLVTGGEDFAVNYLDPQAAYSQLYLTQSKNTSLLTMINIFVHEASHGFNFVLSARGAPSPLLNLNTSLEVPMTEGMAYYREYQYWEAARGLLYRSQLDPAEEAYLALYGDTPEERAQGVLCSELETYIWRVVRYVRALCDVLVNGGKMTYTDFISWAAATTGLSEETLDGECFTFLAMPGYAPCYAVGGATYGSYQKEALAHGISEIDFNTYASGQGFYAWNVATRLMAGYAAGPGGS